MVKSFDVTLPSLTGDKTRKAYIYLPEDYDKTQKRYPVMYMFDGHNLFFDETATYGKSWGLKEYLDKHAVPLIIASVECNHEGHSRLSEYSPVDFSFKDDTLIKGRGKKYMDWLVTSFKPYIDANYRTLPDRLNTAIGGSSMGGLMTVYALAKYNKYFSRGAALSPSLWADGGGAPSFVTGGRFGRDSILYMDYGSREFDNHGVQRKAFSDTAGALIQKGVMLAARIIPGGTHTEASWEKQIPYFMKTLNFEEL